MFLTTRHTWNKATRDEGRLLVPETELYELLQHTRRALIGHARGRAQYALDALLQSALEVATSATGSLRASGDVVDATNRWSRIAGERSGGRFTVGSTRAKLAAAARGASSSSDGLEAPADARRGGASPRTLRSRVAAASANLAAGDGDGDGDGGEAPPPPSLLPPRPGLERQGSRWAAVSEVADTGELGVELDLQIGQMTLRSKHLSALDTDVATHEDVRAIFGEATIQASLLERAEHRQRYRLVGLEHELEWWPGAHESCAPLGERFERDYDPAELYDSEVGCRRCGSPCGARSSTGRSRPRLRSCCPRNAAARRGVAVLLGLHPKLGGPYKLVYLFRRLRCVHVYECLSQARRWWWSLHLATDALLPARAPAEHRDAP